MSIRIWGLIIGLSLFVVRTVWVEFGPGWVIGPALVAAFFAVVPKIHSGLAPKTKHLEEGRRYLQLGALRQAEDHLSAAAYGALRESTKAEVLLELAECKRLQRKYDEAEQAIRESMEIQARLKNASGAVYADCLDRLGNIQKDRGNLQAAVALFGQSLEYLSKLPDADPQALARKRYALVISQYQAGSSPDQVGGLEKALEVCDATLGRMSDESAHLINALGASYIESGEFEKARAVLERGVDLQKQLYGHNDPRSAESLYHLAVVCQHSGEMEKATEYFEHVLALRERHIERDPAEAITVLLRLAEVYAHAGRATRAADYLRRAIFHLESGGRKEGPDLAVAYDLMGTLYQSAGRQSEANDYWERSRSIWKSLPDGEMQSAAVARKQAEVLTALGRHQEAGQLLAES